jgi:hypothetical protein
MKFFPVLLLVTLIFASFSATSYLPQVAATYVGPTESATIYSIADSYVNASSPDTNYGSDHQLYVNASSTDLSPNFIYVKFILTSIPQNAFIVSANLSLWISDSNNLYYSIGGTGDTIGAYYCTDNSWTETEITYNNKPAFDAAFTDYWEVGVLISEGYKSWDITGDVETALPLGVLTEVLRFSNKNNDYGWAVYQSSEATNKPKLEIEYTTSPLIDDTPPEIGIPSQSPPSNDVKNGEQVTVSVTVTDIESGVKNATLFYTINNGESWANQPFNYNPSSDQYEATIAGYEEGTTVKFRMEAYNNAGLKAIKDETEPYSTYQVIPEFSTLGISLLLTVVTLTIIFYRKKCGSGLRAHS